MKKTLVISSAIILSIAGVAQAAEAVKKLDIFAEPDNAATRTMPAAKYRDLLNTRKYSEALALLAQIKETPINKNVLHGWRAQVFESTGRTEEAVEELDKCSDISQISYFGGRTAASAYLSVGRKADALKILNSLLAKYPYGECYQLRANCYRADGKDELAIADYIRAAEMTWDVSKKILTDGCVIYVKKQKYAEGLAMLNRADKRPSSYDTAYFATRGACLIGLQRWAEAEADLSRAIKLCQGRSTYGSEMVLCRSLEGRANCYRHLGKRAEAAADQRAYQQLVSAVDKEFAGSGK